MSESLFVKVGSDLLPVPERGDLLSLKDAEGVDDSLGVCIAVNNSFHHQGKRTPAVQLLFGSQIFWVPLINVEIVQKSKEKENLR